jgi:hypothetical protein
VRAAFLLIRARRTVAGIFLITWRTVARASRYGVFAASGSFRNSSMRPAVKSGKRVSPRVMPLLFERDDPATIAFRSEAKLPAPRRVLSWNRPYPKKTARVSRAWQAFGAAEEIRFMSHFGRSSSWS